MLEAFEAVEICRDDNCNRMGVHPVHAVRSKHAPVAHHRPSRATPVWKQPDPSGLLSAIMKSVPGRVPCGFAQIASGVADDYGKVTDRTVWRGIAKLVERGQLIKLDIGLSIAAYIRPLRKRRSQSGRLDDSEMRDYMLSIIELHPTHPNAR